MFFSIPASLLSSFLGRLYLSPRYIIFYNAKDLQRVELIYHHFARFGLEMHIGCGMSESETECVFFPPPQFFQRLERTSTAACTIQRAFRPTHHAHSGRIAMEEPPKISKPPPQQLSQT